MIVFLIVFAILCVVMLGALILFVATLMSNSCKNANVKSSFPTNSDAKEFVCQRDFRNFAWGYQHNGMFVDSDGKLYRYKEERGKNDMYKKDTEPKTLQELDLNRGEKTFVRQLSSEELSELRQLYENARIEDRGLGKQTTAGFDGGITTYNCYEPGDEKLKVYKLLQFGDQGYDSAGPSGQKLGDWLKTLYNTQDDDWMKNAK